MTKTEYNVINEAWNEAHGFCGDGYKIMGRFSEPNNSFSIILRHPRSHRQLTIVAQPQWGMYLVKEGTKVLKAKTFD